MVAITALLYSNSGWKEWVHARACLSVQYTQNFNGHTGVNSRCLPRTLSYHLPACGHILLVSQNRCDWLSPFVTTLYNVKAFEVFVATLSLIIHCVKSVVEYYHVRESSIANTRSRIGLLASFFTCILERIQLGWPS